MCFVHCDVSETSVNKGMGQGWCCACCVTETAVQNVSDTMLSFRNIKSFQKQRFLLQMWLGRKKRQQKRQLQSASGGVHYSKHDKD